MAEKLSFVELKKALKLSYFAGALGRTDTNKKQLEKEFEKWFEIFMNENGYKSA